MKITGASGGPIRQALTQGPFLMARWLKSRKAGVMEQWTKARRHFENHEV